MTIWRFLHSYLFAFLLHRFLGTAEQHNSAVKKPTTTAIGTYAKRYELHRTTKEDLNRPACIEHNAILLGLDAP